MNRWRILRLGQTDVLVHSSFLLYAIYACISSHTLFLLISTVSILMHEVAHASAASFLGQPPVTLELTPLGAVMRLDDDEHLPPVKRLAMLAAGPAMTFILCFSALKLSGFLPVKISRQIFVCNLSILMLNLLPVLPLDGGRILSLILRIRFSLHTVSVIHRALGNITGLTLIAINMWVSWKLGGWNLSLAFAGCCIIYSSSVSTVSQAMAELRQLMERKIILERKGSLPCKSIIYLSDTPVRKIIRNLPVSRMAMIGCIEPGTMRIKWWASEYDIIQQYLKTPDMQLADVTAFPEKRDNSANSVTN